MRPAPITAVMVALFAGAALADDNVDFFETRIRPVLVVKCYGCHSAEAKKVRGGLRLDSRKATLAGGDGGAVVIPGKPAESRLLAAIAYTDADLKMPPDGKLPPGVIADFKAWIERGAADPRAGNVIKPVDDSWDRVFRERSDWWSFRPVHAVPPPVIAGVEHPVDRFIRDRLAREGIAPAQPADPHALLRRLTFALTGLPPTPAEIDAFVAECHREGSGEFAVPDAAYERVVDRLLASPRFGERFATHWLDLFRYAESHGSEGDPPIPDAWRYRDYVVRAFNADVPWRTLVMEHLAGDLMPQPRAGESPIALASLRFMEHGFQPVESLEEQAKTIDNQIDVTSKAFLGLTVNCSRCHDHKFDPISQKDYTAMYGVFAGVRPAHLSVDPGDSAALAKLSAMKPKIRAALAAAWIEDAAAIRERLAQLSKKTLEEAAKDRRHALHAWAKLADKEGEPLARGWRELVKAAGQGTGDRGGMRTLWDLRKPEDLAKWTTHGVNVTPAGDGAFALRATGNQVLQGIYPAGVFNHLLSSRPGGVIASPRFKITTERISIRMITDGGAGVRVVVDDYPLGFLGTFPSHREPRPAMGWITLNTGYRKGSQAYIELAAFDNQTVREMPRNGGAKIAPGTADGRSIFGVVEVVAHDGDGPPNPPTPLPAADREPASADELATAYGKMIRRLVADWTADGLGDADALLLDGLVRAGVLRNDLKSMPDVAVAVAEYRAVEGSIAIPARAPGVLEAVGRDVPLHVRGSPKQPGAIVPRAALSVLGGRAFDTPQSGRLELAESIVDRRNPLSHRVIVNRVWLWVFGRGIAATPDNFGHLGEPPTHLELLDYLAARFADDNGGSIKRLVRDLVMTRTFRQSSQSTDAAFAKDPGNRWLGRADIRRLDAEQVRDSFLAIAGELSDKAGGPGAWNGPLDEGRRSLYLQARRSEPHPFLAAFDKPIPSGTRGLRDVTTQPSQALALLNSPFTRELSQRWGRRLSSVKGSTADKIRAMHLAVLGREPTVIEAQRAADYLASAAKDQGVGLSDPRPWQDLSHAFFCLTEAINLP